MDDEMVDEYALAYAETHDSATFDELFQAVRPKVDRIAVASTYKFEQLRVPVEDFKSFYYQAVWEAADTYNGRSHFWQRLYTFLKVKDVNIYRHYGAKKRAAYLVDCLDEDSTLSVESDVTEDMLIKEILEGFLAKTSERNKQIVVLLKLGYTKLEIAAALGHNEYDDATRKAVERARNKLRQYMQSKLAS